MNYLRPKLTLVLCSVVLMSLLLGTRSAAAVERPFKAKGSGVVDPNSGDLTASGTATHLGKWTLDGNLAFTPNGADPSILDVSGTATFTAANGDELDAVITGTLNPATGVGTGSFTFNGGTGRFDDASGSATFSVQQDPAGTFDITLDGTIDF